MLNVFSFCLYGTDLKYYKGMLANIDLISEHFPNYQIWVYISSPNHLSEYVDKLKTCPNVCLKWSGSLDGRLTYERYLPLEDPTVETCFVRDADSRVDGRDRWCIEAFLASSKSFHTIRDNYWHKSRLMAGLTGWRRRTLRLSDKFPDVTYKYGDEELFLNSVLYPLVKGDLLIHTNICAYLDEKPVAIEPAQTSAQDFCGQVYEADGSPKFSYDDFPKAEQIRWLHSQNQHRLLDNVYRMWNLHKTAYDERTQILDAAFIANWYLGQYDRCMEVLRGFEFAEITQHVIFNSSFMYDVWQSQGYKIIGTTDPLREPAEKEVVIVYGAYPHWVQGLPCSRKILTNIQNLFSRPRHTTFEFDTVWEPVEEIWIMGLEERHDRFVETCLELARLGAPLDRIKHYKAKKDGRSPYYGATKNHLDVVQAFHDGPARRALFLEDDFCFTSSVAEIKASLSKFWSRPYDFHIAFLAASKSGRREMEDDLLVRTYQLCTTSSAYFLQKPRAAEVLAVIKDGYEKMEATGDTNTFCIDRYWAKLSQHHKMYIFRPKLGFQRATYSNIQGRVTYNLD